MNFRWLRANMNYLPELNRIFIGYFGFVGVFFCRCYSRHYDWLSWTLCHQCNTTIWIQLARQNTVNPIQWIKQGKNGEISLSLMLLTCYYRCCNSVDRGSHLILSEWYWVQVQLTVVSTVHWTGIFIMVKGKIMKKIALETYSNSIDWRCQWR